MKKTFTSIVGAWPTLLLGTTLAMVPTAALAGPIDVISDLAMVVYDWIKAPALVLAIAVAAIGIIKVLVKGATNPGAHKDGIRTIVSAVILLFLLFVLPGIFSFIQSFGESVSSRVEQSVKTKGGTSSSSGTSIPKTGEESK